ncbi:MAG: bifunctional oligoribonuclease/PAP phosphatase NrnA [Candidatus Hodarchaeota archaeon]
MIYQKFDNFISFLKNKNIIITTHDLVDLDGIASSFALKFLLNFILNKPKIEIIFSKISKPVKDFMVKFSNKFPDFDFSYKTKLDFSTFEVIIVLDTNNLDLVEFEPNFDISQTLIPFVFIDHHLNLNKYSKNESSNNLIFDNFTSTAEIVYELSKHYQINFPTSYKYLLQAAILTDSGFFKYSNNDTIQRSSDLLSNDVNIQEILSSLTYEIDLSEKIAKIKGMQRTQLKKLGNYLVGISNVSSFGASVASMLINIGFDIAIVYSKERSEFKITTRARNDLCLETGLHLGNILNNVSEGSGGGHDGAASLNGIFDLEKIIDEILENIKQILIVS